jgi:hypothetical protein
MEALASAGELEHVGIVEALELCLLVLDRAPRRYPRAALRWHGRYCQDHKDVALEESVVTLAAHAALPSACGKTAARALAEMLDHRGLERAGEVLIRWAASA